MLLLPVIIDERVSWEWGGACCSLLTLPLGSGTVLDHLQSKLSEIEHGRTTILAGADASDEYKSRLAALAGDQRPILDPAALAEWVRTLETSDYLLVIEPRYWPVSGHSFRLLTEDAQYRGATHMIGVGEDSAATRELVECDARGQVKRVQRLYQTMNWPEVANSAAMCSLVPARITAGMDMSSLRSLRASLGAAGTLSRDCPLQTDVVDLTHEISLLRIQERAILACMSESPPAGYQCPSEGVLVGEGCNIHSSARLVAPLIVQPGCEIEDGVVLIGPTVIGRGTRIRRCSTIAQAVVMDHTDVPSETICRHRVIGSKFFESGEADRERGFDDVIAPDLAGDEIDSNWDELTGQSRLYKFQLAVKRVVDIVLSALGLVVTAPLLAVIAVLVKLDNPGPALFRHRREKMGGGEFPCLKFRTMVSDAHIRQRELYEQSEVDGPQFKMRSDPRVTRLGRFLRASNLDELPQLINVLLGHMSLVGPRPSPFRENQVCVPWRMARLSVRPGITGLWQVCRGGAGPEGFHEWIHYDVLYVRHFSGWLDTKIILATVLSLGGHWPVPVHRLIPRHRLANYE